MAQMPETITFNVQPKRPWQIVLVVMGILLLVSLAGNWYQWDSAKSNQEASEIDRSALGDIIEARQAEIIKSDSLISTLTKKVAKDSLETLRLTTGLKTSISGLKGKIKELGQITPQEVADTTCARLIQVSQLKDSVIQKQDELISTLEERHIGQILDLHALIKEKTSQIMAQIAVSEALGQVVTNLETENKKQKRKTVFWKITSGVLAAGVVIISLKE